MAAISLLEKKEVQEILASLKKMPHTAKELNQSIVINQSLCSTATLYRRLSELQMASIIVKPEEYYELSDFGHSLYQEFANQANLILDSKMQRVLGVLGQQGSLSTSELMSNLSISPNDLVEILEKLEKEKMVEKELVRPPSPKGGRPRKLYHLSKRGTRSSEEYEKLKDKVKKK